MGNSEIKDKFGYLVVNDREDMSILLRRFIKARLGVPDEKILETDGSSLEEIEGLLKEIYERGLYPIILLDENLGTDIAGGSEVLEHLVKNYPEGGLAVGCSSMGSADQCRIWESLIGTSETKWTITPLEDFSIMEELEKPMKDFLEKQEREKGDSELGNNI